MIEISKKKKNANVTENVSLLLHFYSYCPGMETIVVFSSLINISYTKM